MRKLNLDDDLDPLSNVLRAVHFRSTIFCRSELTAPWGFSVAGRDIVTFHFVERGDCWLDVRDANAKVRLRSGDLVLLPHGHPHLVRDRPRSPVMRLDDLLNAHRTTEAATLHFGGDGRRPIK